MACQSDQCQTIQSVMWMIDGGGWRQMEVMEDEGEVDENSVDCNSFRRMAEFSG